MTKTVFYTHTFQPESEVISEVVYNDETNEMYVMLHNDVVCGYGRVPFLEYTRFRLAPSAGRYWNLNIKHNPAYKGIDGDAMFVPAKQTDEPLQFTKTTENSEFKVVVRVEGTLEFLTDQPDALAAAQHIKEILNKAVVDGIAFIKEVKVVE